MKELRRSAVGLLVGWWFLWALAPLHAQPAAAEATDAIRIVLRPADEPAPALRYHLLPSARDRHRGNAAIHYYKAAEINEGPKLDELWEQTDRWPQRHLDKSSLEAVGAALAKMEPVLEELEFAARCDQCDWQLRLEKGPRLQLPEIQKMRAFARVLSLKARYEIAHGKLDDALGTLQVGYAMARHVAQGPTLINALVAVAIQEVMNVPLIALSEHEPSPNLYWALTMMPDPLIDFRPAFETEMNLLWSYPVFQDPEHARRTPEEWLTALEEIGADADVEGQAVKGHTQTRAMVFFFALAAYPDAKRRLIAEGRSAKDVEAMPVLQAVVIDAARTYEQIRDERMRWCFVPYWQASKGMKQAADADVHLRRTEVLPLAQTFLTDMRPAMRVSARAQRKLASLRIIEALRLYAARHGGQLPRDLSQIREVPLPIDPVTGKDFVYTGRDKTAVLEGPDPPGTADMWRLRYEIKLNADAPPQ